MCTKAGVQLETNSEQIEGQRESGYRIPRFDSMGKTLVLLSAPHLHFTVAVTWNTFHTSQTLRPINSPSLSLQRTRATTAAAATFKV